MIIVMDFEKKLIIFNTQEDVFSLRFFFFFQEKSAIICKF